MRSRSAKRGQAALLSGFAAFAFFSLAWHFAGGFGLSFSVGLAAFMGAIVAVTNWGLVRTLNARQR
jgi:hypothetical protein